MEVLHFLQNILEEEENKKKRKEQFRVTGYRERGNTFIINNFYIVDIITTNVSS